MLTWKQLQTPMVNAFQIWWDIDRECRDVADFFEKGESWGRAICEVGRLCPSLRTEWPDTPLDANEVKALRAAMLDTVNSAGDPKNEFEEVRVLMELLKE